MGRIKLRERAREGGRKEEGGKERIARKEFDYKT